VALVKTAADGSVSQPVPTDSGLSGGNCATNGQGGCVIGLAVHPDLGTGHYQGLTVDLKDAGVSPDGTTPNIARLQAGTSTAQLFERTPLPPFTAP
jgi:hypothetical protein